jgi:hypothetical protein
VTRFAEGLRPVVEGLKKRGMNLCEIARKLNARGIATCHGKQRRAEQVKRLLVDNS